MTTHPATPIDPSGKILKEKPLMVAKKPNANSQAHKVGMVVDAATN